MKFLPVCLAVGLLCACRLLGAERAAPLVFLAGDSTMSAKPLDLPECGWGMALNGFFADTAMVQNHAMNGRSTKSFITEGRWARLLAAVQPGDYVIIQFGHNDEKIDKPGVGTDVATEYPDNLRRFVRDVREKKAFPILATSIARRKFDATGKLVPTHGKYPDAVRAVARELDVPLLDLEQASEQWLQATGDEPSKQYFMWIEPGRFPQLPKGLQDDTHLVASGARKVAELAAQQMRALGLPLARWLKEPARPKP